MAEENCPLISRYGVNPDEPAWGNSNTDWMKLICTDYCPVGKCVLDMPKLKRHEVNQILMRITLSMFVIEKRDRIPTISCGFP